MTLVGRWGQILVSSNISENWDLTPVFRDLTPVFVRGI